MAKFFSFDGIDGVGKSTQLGQFSRWLGDSGHDVIVCRDPGGTKLGEVIREILLDHGDVTIGARSEMLLYMASRAQLVDEVIRPALSAGKTVVSDRFLLANVVYQGYGGGLAVDDLWEVGKVATAGLQPELTILLDLPAVDAMRRLGRATDRMESRGTDYLERVRQGFLDEAERRTDVAVIDAAAEIGVIQSEIRRAVIASGSLDA